MKSSTIHNSANCNILLIKVNNTKNNTFLSVLHADGTLLRKWTTGTLGYSGARKRTVSAQQAINREVLRYIKGTSVTQLSIHYSGYKKKFLSTLEQLITSLVKNNIRILKIHNTTPLAHNGTPRSHARRC